MGSYSKPQKRLHHEFIYLNHESVLNALSAFEAGAVDQILLKTSKGREGGAEAGVSAGPIKAGGKKGKQETVQEELIRSRTWFSAFDAWHNYLERNDAVGTFDEWDEGVRDALAVGDTIKFEAHIVLSPLHKIISAYLSFVSGSTQPGSPFKPATAAAAKENAKTARMMEGWITGKGGHKNLSVYLQPGLIAEPRILARLDERFMIGGLDAVEGEYTVIAQVDSVLREDEQVSIIRLLRDAPPTPIEIETVTEGVLKMADAAKEMGVELGEGDVTFSHPTVLVRPLAIYR